VEVDEDSISREERFDEFLRRLAVAPAAKTFDEAYSQLCNILNEVEDEMTSIPYDAMNWRTDGRLYPPLLDNIRDVQDRPLVKRFRSRGHNTFIGENGSIEIEVVNTRVTIFSKPGDDRRRVGDL
jgi:hypothetical protein